MNTVIINEKTYYRLQNILLNNEGSVQDLTRNMYYRSNKPAYNAEDGAIWLEPKQNYDFSTYFNSFSISKWRKYTGLERIYLILDLKGDFSVGLFGFYKIGDYYQKEWFGRYRFPNKERTRVLLEFPKNMDSCVIGFEVTAESDTLFYDGYYATENMEINAVPTQITLITTTYNKEKYIKKNIKLFSKKLLEDEDYKDYFNWVIVDNGKTLGKSLDLHEKIRIIPNNNVGGAGGFCRGMLEINKQSEKPTHVLLMDDDVVFQPESFKRLFTLLSLLKEEYRDCFFSGAMLKMAQPNIQHEDIGRLNSEGFHEAAKRNLDLNDWENIVENELFEAPDSGHYYAAWWFCCIPSEFIRPDNLPLPFFVRGDDVEYSLRNHARLITMNGICIWHEGFEGKFSAALEFYQVCRNELIICAMHPEYSDVNVLGHIQMLFWEEMYKFNYKGASLLLDAFEDFMKGPDYLAGLDGEQILKEKRTLDNHLAPITSHIRQQIDYGQLFEYEQFKSGQRKFIYDYSYNGQARIPAFLTGRNTGVIPYGWGYYPGKLNGCNKVIAVDVTADKYVWYIKSRKEFRGLKKRYKGLMKLYDNQKDRIYHQYQEEKNYLMSEQFWKTKLQ